MALRKPSLESARCSAGELTLGEFGSEVWDKEERPRVNMLKLGRAAMVEEDRGGEWEEGRGECWERRQENGRGGLFF